MAPSECPHEATLNAFPPSTAYDSTVTVAVGPEKKKYQVHRGLLIHHGTYFKHALHGDWIEAQDQVITLSEDSTEVFDAIYSWLYTRRLYDSATDSSVETKVSLNFLTLCQIYVFGHVRGIPAVCNAAVDCIIAKAINENVVPTNCIRYVYENTLPGSNLRKLMVEFVIIGLQPETLYNVRDKLCEDFLIDLVVSVSNLRPKCKGPLHGYRALQSINRCSFHTHGDPQSDQGGQSPHNGTG
ncbi:hypothetical protein EV356DRAFT_505068 [Viridothelium virens]|uniref:BTB domain-containing protein n=1 Tax=Viridothelium virens TaxID=1048519 RepID=A0A6A6H3T1_VIRVR|nr:hypothetical protein EV356DRAFT_505068 [Viridothelium virens]